MSDTKPEKKRRTPEEVVAAMTAIAEREGLPNAVACVETQDGKVFWGHSGSELAAYGLFTAGASEYEP